MDNETLFKYYVWGSEAELEIKSKRNRNIRPKPKYFSNQRTTTTTTFIGCDTIELNLVVPKINAQIHSRVKTTPKNQYDLKTKNEDNLQNAKKYPKHKKNKRSRKVYLKGNSRPYLTEP